MDLPHSYAAPQRPALRQLLIFDGQSRGEVDVQSLGRRNGDDGAAGLQHHLFEGLVGIDYGVYGVPETYVIDKAGVIRYKFVGAVTPALLAEKVLPLIAELNKS